MRRLAVWGIAPKICQFYFYTGKRTDYIQILIMEIRRLTFLYFFKYEEKRKQNKKNMPEEKILNLYQEKER